jgi:site-specific DNA recombinase
MNAVIYCRVSTREQVEGISLELQQERCTEFAKSKAMTVLEVFVEEGESAKVADRPKLLAALEFCRRHRGHVEAFIVYKLDRFSRKTADHYAITSTLANQGIRLFSVTEPIDNTPVGHFLEAIFAANAQLDNDIKSERTKEYMRRRLHEGIWVWKPPLGYVSGKKPTDEKKTVPDLLDSKTFPILRRARQEYLKGLYSQIDIARMLKQWGLEEATGRRVHVQFVRKIFTNPYYAGILVDPWTGEEVPGRHQPMVTQEEFAQVQLILAGKGLPAAPHIKNREEFPLRAFVRCGTCRTPYTASLARGRSERYPYYHCRNKNCAEYGKTVRVKDLHENFLSRLRQVTPHKEYLAAFKAVVLDVWQQQSANSSHDREGLQKTFEKLKREKAGLIELKIKGLLTDAEFIDAKKVIDEKLTAAMAALQDMPGSESDLRTEIESAFAAIENAPAEWEHMELPNQQRFQQIVFPQGIPFARTGGFGTAELALVYSLPGQSVSKSSSLVDLCFSSWNRLMMEMNALATLRTEATQGCPAEDLLQKQAAA